MIVVGFREAQLGQDAAHVSFHPVSRRPHKCADRQREIPGSQKSKEALAAQTSDYRMRTLTHGRFDVPCHTTPVR